MSRSVAVIALSSSAHTFQRVALLDELNSAQQEIASLRVQLRQEQRKNARAGAPSPAPTVPAK